jgi:hypothetical protein
MVLESNGYGVTDLQRASRSLAFCGTLEFNIIEIQYIIRLDVCKRVT